MTTEVLKEKVARYLSGQSVPSEKRQIQNWLSCTMDNEDIVPAKEKQMIENEIVGEILAYANWTAFEPKEESLWKKVTAFF